MKLFLRQVPVMLNKCRHIYNFLILVLMVLAASVFLLHASSALAQQNTANADALKKAIDAKSAEMKQLEEARKVLEAQLGQVSKVSKTLSSDLTAIDSSIKRLELQITTNKVALEKLEYEQESLQIEIQDIEYTITDQRLALAKLVYEMQQREETNFFLTFFKRATLSDYMAEFETISSLNGVLNERLNELKQEQVRLTSKFEESQAKLQEEERTRQTLNNRQYIVQDQREEKSKLLQETRSTEKIYAVQIAELEKKQTEITKIIEEYETQIRASFNPAVLPSGRHGVMSYPVTEPILTQGYGATKFAERAYKSKFHNGLDFGASIGTPVYAAADGTVMTADNNDTGSQRWQRYQYGKYVMLSHENSLATLYAHLSRYVVSRGDKVSRGDIIGYVGNTGYATGPHLHFSVFWGPSVQFKSIPPAAGRVPVGVTVDPNDYL